jgi:hypothetical protein
MRRTLLMMSLLSLAAFPLSGCVWHHDDEHDARYAPAPAYYQGGDEHAPRDVMAPPQQRFPAGEPHDQDDFDHR